MSTRYVSALNDIADAPRRAILRSVQRRTLQNGAISPSDVKQVSSPPRRASLPQRGGSPVKNNVAGNRAALGRKLPWPFSATSGKAPLFRTAIGRTGVLTEKAMHRVDAWRMVQRRAADLGTRVRIGCHTFRATGITAYLEAGGTLENAQAMAAHESPRTTKLYDRTADEITLDEVERIAI